MRKIPTNTLHLFAAIGMVVFTLFLISYNLYRQSNYAPLPLSAWTNPNLWKQVLASHDTRELNCKPPATADKSDLPHNAQLIANTTQGEQLIATKEGDAWQITLFDPETKKSQLIKDNIFFPSDTLTKSFAPIKNSVAYPNCKGETGCFIHLLSLESEKEIALPAITSTDPKQPINNISNVIFDEAHHFISYLTNNPVPNTRIVLSDKGKLLHNIHQTLPNGHNLQLHFYQPQENLMVFTDDHGNTFHYDPTGIALYINECSLEQ